MLATRSLAGSNPASQNVADRIVFRFCVDSNSRGANMHGVKFEEAPGALASAIITR
jgi:hypothetical protein